MGRQSISFTEPNDKWLKAQVDSQEYSSKSELVNDLIRQARKQQQEIDYIRMKIEKAEKSGFIKDSQADILKEAKKPSDRGLDRCDGCLVRGQATGIKMKCPN